MRAPSSRAPVAREREWCAVERSRVPATDGALSAHTRRFARRSEPAFSDRAGPGLGCLMSQATASAFEAGAADAFASTRANYERFAFLLLRVGHVPGLALAHLDFRVLLFLLAQKPGQYAAHHGTIAKACDTNVTSIKRALSRLHAAGLVLWELIPPHHALPTGRFTRTNVNRYWVHLPRLGALLEGPMVPPPTRAETTSSTRSNSTSSYGTEIRSEQKPPPLPPREPPAASAAPPPTVPASEEEAFNSIALTTELEPVCQSWERLGLGKLDARSVRALENRRAEGATLQQLEAAVVGAGADDWIRRRAKVPFAVVFATLASVERFAHEGRKILDAKDFAARRAAEELRAEREWRAERERAERYVPTADDLRQLLPPPSPPMAKAQPMTLEELHRRRDEQRAMARAWAQENE